MMILFILDIMIIVFIGAGGPQIKGAKVCLDSICSA